MPNLPIVITIEEGSWLRDITYRRQPPTHSTYGKAIFHSLGQRGPRARNLRLLCYKAGVRLQS